MAVLSVGLAIGLAGSVGSVAYTAMFGRLPYPEPERLVELWQTPEPRNTQPSDYLDPVRMLEWVGMDARHLEGIAATGMGPTLIMNEDDAPLSVDAAPVVGDWFATMGVPAVRGRVLTLEDEQPGAERAVVVSQAFERAHSTELGSTIELSGIVYVVVGVMPREFESAERVWVTIESLPEERPVAYAGVARVRDGSTAGEAALEIQQLAAAQVAADSGRYAGLGATARPYGSMARGPSRPRLWMLAGVVLAVVLIGMSNLTQLYLVRAQGRSRALAVRAALGGDAWQVGGGLATEGIMVGGLGGVLGLALTFLGKDAIRVFLGGEYAFPSDPVVGVPILALVTALAVLISAALAVEPVRRVGSLDLQGLLQRRAAGSVTTRGERRTQRLLVVVQVATCVVLSAAATVLGSAYRALYRIDMGYDADRVVQAKPDYGTLRMDVEEQWDVARTIAERLRGHPAVSAVAVWEMIGEDYPPRPDFDAVFDGPPREIGLFDRLNRYYAVEPGFFEAMGIDVVGGRALSASDGRGQPPVAVVTRGGAEAWWPGEDPIGHQVRLGGEGTWMTVVGVVEDIHALDELGRTIAAIPGRRMQFLFAPAEQLPVPPVGWRRFGCCSGVMIGVRPRTSTSLAAEAIATELQAVAPSLSSEISTMATLQVREGYSGRTIADTGRMVGAGVAIAVLLAVLGIVGVVSEGLSRRTREIGLRMALGARRHEVVGLTARESVLTALSGVALGLLAIMPLDRALSGVVFGYDVQRLTDGALDPRVLTVSTLVVVAVTTIAAVVSATRATRVDPGVALGSE